MSHKKVLVAAVLAVAVWVISSPLSMVQAAEAEVERVCDFTPDISGPVTTAPQVSVYADGTDICLYEWGAQEGSELMVVLDIGWTRLTQTETPDWTDENGAMFRFGGTQAVSWRLDASFEYGFHDYAPEWEVTDRYDDGNPNPWFDAVEPITLDYWNGFLIFDACWKYAWELPAGLEIAIWDPAILPGADFIFFYEMLTWEATFCGGYYSQVSSFTVASVRGFSDDLPLAVSEDAADAGWEVGPHGFYRDMGVLEYELPEGTGNVVLSAEMMLDAPERELWELPAGVLIDGVETLLSWEVSGDSYQASAATATEEISKFPQKLPLESLISQWEVTEEGDGFEYVGEEEEYTVFLPLVLRP